MTRLRYRAPFLAAALLACSPSGTNGAGGPDSGASAKSSTSEGELAPGSGTASDPKMLALMKDALSCNFVNGDFVACPAVDAFFSSHDPYFDSPEGDRALAEMLAGTDEKVATVATHRSGNARQAAMSDKARVERLLGAMERPGVSFSVRTALVHWLAAADFDTLGLGDRLKAFAKSSDVEVRRSIGTGILDDFEAKLKSRSSAEELVGALLVDADGRVVVETAIGAGRTATEGSRQCELLAQGIDKNDEKSPAIAVGASFGHHCKGLAAKVVDFVDGRTVDPSKIANRVGISYMQAIGTTCGYANGDLELKHHAYGVLVRLVDPKDPDPNTREAAVWALPDCDRDDGQQSRAQLEKLTKDSVKAVADRAKEKLEQLAKNH